MAQHVIGTASSSIQVYRYCCYEALVSQVVRCPWQQQAWVTPGDALDQADAYHTRFSLIPVTALASSSAHCCQKAQMRQFVSSTDFFHTPRPVLFVLSSQTLQSHQSPSIHLVPVPPLLFWFQLQPFLSLRPETWVSSYSHRRRVESALIPIKIAFCDI